MDTDFDLVVIGGGSGGLACAQRAAEYGARALLVEYARLGGCCVNVGCVPKKVMWNAASVALRLTDANDYGFDVTVGGSDWPALKRKRDAYVLRLNGIYERNLAAKGVALTGANGAAPLACFGEVGLTGELRTVGHPDRRLAEAHKFGLTPVLEPNRHKTLRSAFAAAFARRRDPAVLELQAADG